MVAQPARPSAAAVTEATIPGRDVVASSGTALTSASPNPVRSARTSATAGPETKSLTVRATASSAPVPPSTTSGHDVHFASSRGRNVRRYPSSQGGVLGAVGGQ